MLTTERKDNFQMLHWLDELLIGHNGFIVGGCFKNIFNKEKVKDIDIFFHCHEDYDEAVDYFDRMTVGFNGDDKLEEEYRFLYSNENVKAYIRLKDNLRVELCCKIFGSPADILNQFDFTITKFAYYNAYVSKQNSEILLEAELPDPFLEQPAQKFTVNKEIELVGLVTYDNKYFEHLHLHRLVVDNKLLYPISTFERVLKYVKYGYMPCKETKLKLIQAIRNTNIMDDVALSKSLYNGMD